MKSPILQLCNDSPKTKTIVRQSKISKTGSDITLRLSVSNGIISCGDFICYDFETGNIIEQFKMHTGTDGLSNHKRLLSIGDNGRGLPVDFDSKLGASMGMELLQRLTDDLGGSFTIESDSTTHIKVIFDYKPVSPANVAFS